MNVIDEVRREREDLARVLKKHTGIRKIVEDLYPDSAHFIYELLQNAEDTGATEAQFTLSKDSLVFEHNGRSFELRDIYAITDIGEGTKANDDEKIGRFGVGFKAVFAYSETPHIWSPTFAFKITDLVLPHAIEPLTVSGNKTRFEFPFSNPKKPANKAYAEVEAGLNELAETTLLFLSHLESIGWRNASGKSGEILRFKHSDNHFEILKQSEGKTTASSHFLKFYQPVAGLEKQQIAIAYSLDFLPNVHDFDPKIPLAKQLKIIPANPGRVAVFFPAEKETSGLRFHLHAPFVPELSRASIKETDANQPLFNQLAALAAASLHQIRDLGMLTAEFLSVLPNPQDQIPQRYDGIRESIIEEMNEQPLTPTYTKSHAPAKHLLQAKATLKWLLSANDIEFLVDGDVPPQWAVAASQRNSNADRFLTGLKIRIWDVNEFISLLGEKANVILEPDEDFMDWLANKPIAWHQQFYSLLHEELQPNEDWSQLDDLNIVRMSNGEYSTGKNAYFPGEGVDHDDALPRVDKNVYSLGTSKAQQESAKKLLEEIGVREVGEAEQVEAILKQRYVTNNFKPNKGDLKRFVSLLEKEADKAKLFKDYCIFKCKDGKWRKPSWAFLDQPFMDTGLGAYYDTFGDKAQCFALADSHKDCGIDIKRLAKFAEAVGVRTHLEITKTTCRNNPDWQNILSKVYGKRSLPIDEDYAITGLDKLLKKPSLALSKLIWHTMYSLPSYPDCLLAIYQHNRSEGYTEADSQLVHQLREFAWIPQGEDTFVCPAEASRDLLPEGFPFDPGWHWLKAIHFGEEAIKQSESYRQKQTSAKELGFDSADSAAKWAELDKHGISPDEILAQHAQRHRTSQPEEPVPDPVRRRKNILANAADAPDMESVLRERSIQVGMSDVTAQAKAYLRTKYKNSEGQLVCQCCHEEMPFKLRSGEHYFEAVQCIEDKEMRYFQNRLALCPNCAAMYQYARETDDAEIRRLIIELDAEDQSPAVEIPVQLADREYTLRFVGTHWFDLKTILSGNDVG